MEDGKEDYRVDYYLVEAILVDCTECGPVTTCASFEEAEEWGTKHLLEVHDAENIQPVEYGEDDD